MQNSQVWYQVMPDLFFYRDPEEVEREEAAKEAEVTASKQQDFAAPPSKEEWGGDQQVNVKSMLI